MGFDAYEPPEPPPPPQEVPSLAEKFDEVAAQSVEEQGDGGDFRIPRANDDVAGTQYEQSDGTAVIGRLDDTVVARDWEGHAVIDLSPNPDANEVWAEAYENGQLRDDGRKVTEPGWSPEVNDDWVDSIVENQGIVYLGSEPSADHLVSGDGEHPSVFAGEIERLEATGYERVGDYLVPGELGEAFAESKPAADRYLTESAKNIRDLDPITPGFNKVAPRDVPDPGEGDGDTRGDGTESPAHTLDLEP